MALTTDTVICHPCSSQSVWQTWRLTAVQFSCSNKQLQCTKGWATSVAWTQFCQAAMFRAVWVHQLFTAQRLLYVCLHKVLLSAPPITQLLQWFEERFQGNMSSSIYLLRSCDWLASSVHGYCRAKSTFKSELPAHETMLRMQHAITARSWNIQTACQTQLSKFDLRQSLSQSAWTLMSLFSTGPYIVDSSQVL